MDTICFTGAVSTCFPCSAAAGQCAGAQLTVPLANGPFTVETAVATDGTLIVGNGEQAAAVPASRKLTLMASYPARTASIVVRPETAASEPLIHSAQQGGARACQRVWRG
jgi:hypothetical protein